MGDFKITIFEAPVTTQGRMQDFSGEGGPSLKFYGILDIHAAKRHVASSEPLLGGFGGMPPQENF